MYKRQEVNYICYAFSLNLLSSLLRMTGELLLILWAVSYTHLAQHYARGLALHHLCDWACLLNRYGLHIPEDTLSNGQELGNNPGWE